MTSASTPTTMSVSNRISKFSCQIKNSKTKKYSCVTWENGIWVASIFKVKIETHDDLSTCDNFYYI